MISIKTNILLCNKCKIFSSSPVEHPTYNYCYICHCSNQSCNNSWLACSKHFKKFSTLNNRSRIIDHFNNKDHLKIDIAPSKIDSENNIIMCKLINQETKSLTNQNDDEASFQSVLSKGSVFLEDKEDDQDTNSNISQENNVLLPPSKRAKSDPNMVEYIPGYFLPESYTSALSSRKFFESEMESTGNGCRRIVGRAFLKDNSSDICASENETDLHMNITHFCSSLTKLQMTQFAYIASSLAQPKSFLCTRPPLSYNDIKNFYTESNTSIYNNLPSPKVFELDNHACVSIEDIINHTLAFGIEMDSLSDIHISSDNSMTDKNSINNTKESFDIIQSVRSRLHRFDEIQPIILTITLWSDDFDANHTRKNRKSTWVQTITICPPKISSTSPLHTYPIALGTKNQNHDIVKEYFNKEIEKLRRCTLRYSKSHNKLYPVIIEPLVISADRPERSSMNRILNHNGNSTKRWLFSERISRKNLPSCKLCFVSRYKILNEESYSTSIMRKCNRCCDWVMSSDKKASMFLPPEYYPKKKHNDSPLPPDGRDICKSASEKLKPIRVTYSHLVAAVKFGYWNYLHSVWSKAEIRSYFRLVGISSDYVKTLINNADDFKKHLPVNNLILDSIPIPSMWKSCYRLEQCIDAPMHLLFQGITNTIIDQGTEFLKGHRAWSSFGTSANLIIDKISLLNIEFCKVDLLQGSEFTTGGWIGESYLGFARISAIVFSIACEKCPQNALGLNEFQCMVQSMLALISRLMTDSKICHNELDHYVKLFLSSCHLFHSCIYVTKSPKSPNAKNPFWNTGNFLSILNLPKQIDQFGALRHHWEGNHERFIQFVKPYLKNMRTTTSYLCTKLEYLQKNNLLQNMLIKSFDFKTHHYNRYRNIHAYNDLDSVISSISNGSCLSGIISHNNNKTYVGVTIRSQGFWSIHPIQFEDTSGFHLNNQWFSKIKVEEVDFMNNVTYKKLETSIVDFVLFVPSSSFEDKETRYNVIARSWKTRHGDGLFKFPLVSNYRLVASVGVS